MLVRQGRSGSADYAVGMARMTPAEATAVNVLLGYMAGKGMSCHMRWPVPWRLSLAVHTTVCRLDGTKTRFAVNA